MTRSCHPNSKDTQTDTDQHEEKREGIASYLIVEIPTEISAERRGEAHGQEGSTKGKEPAGTQAVNEVSRHDRKECLGQHS